MSVDELKRVLDLQNSSIELQDLESYVDQFSKNQQQVFIIPTLHNQLGFSKLISEFLDNHTINTIMLELPVELEEQLTTAIDRLPVPSVLHNNELRQKNNATLIPQAGTAYIIQPGESLYWAGFLGRRNGIPVQFIDHWHPQAYQTWQIPLGYEHLSAVGWRNFWNEGSELAELHLSEELHRNRTKQMAQKLVNYINSCQPDEKILVVCGAAHWPGFVSMLNNSGWDTGDSMVPLSVIDNYSTYIEDAGEIRTADPGRWNLTDIHPHSLHLVTSALPFYLTRFVEYPKDYDHLEVIRQLYFSAEKRYKKKFDDQVSPSSYQRMFQYLRNLGRLQGQVLPDLFNLIAGAKGMVDDDYAFEVYTTAISYGFLPDDDSKLDEELKFVPDEEQGEVIKFAFKRRFKRPVLKKINQDEFDDLDPIPDEDYPGQWQEIWDKYSPYGYVSYPPEDEFIEQYMQYLRKRIIEILMEEESSTMEFETSLEDGIDWRETMRHYHEGKIFVKKYPKNKYQVGALIVQFLEEPYDEAEYSHHSTLFAEHDQESHISVITTEPGDVLVGPGISRVKYAAIISQFPPVGMPYLISNQNIDLKLRLIWTAIHMSLNKIIGFVAKKPPTAAQRHFAAEHGYRLVYLPMGQLTAQSLRRLRTMHLLAHRDLRDNAREYIGF